MLKALCQLASENVLIQPGVRFFSWVIKNQISTIGYQIFYIQVYGNMAEENRMYEQLQKICSREKVFWANSGKISFGTPKNYLPSMSSATDDPFLQDIWCFDTHSNLCRAGTRHFSTLGLGKIHFQCPLIALKKCSLMMTSYCSINCNTTFLPFWKIAYWL